MKNRLLLASLLLMVILSIIAIPVFAYTYSAPVSVTENGTQSTDMVAMGFDSNNVWMADNGFMGATGNDTRIQTLGGNEKPHMVADNATYFALPVAKSSQTNLFYTTWNSALSAFKIVLGYLGYYTMSDNASTEPSDNFSIELSGWVDTSYASANQTYVDKTDAIKVWNSAADTINVTTGSYAVSFDGTTYITSTSAFGDVNFKNQAITLDFWALFDASGSQEMLIGIKPTTATFFGLEVYKRATDKFSLVWHRADNNSTGRDPFESTTFTFSTGTWYHIKVSYDGSGDPDTSNIVVNINDSVITMTTGAFSPNWTIANNTIVFGDLDGASLLNGDMLGVKVYDDATATNMVGNWSLGEGTGVTANDVYGNNGTITNGTWVATSIGSSVATTGLASGEYTVVVWLDGTNLHMSVNGVETDNASANAVPDNSNDWIVSYNGTMPYMNYFKLYKNGNLVAWHQPTSMIFGTFLPDRAIGNSGVITWGSNPANIDVTLGSITSTSQPSLGATTDMPTRDLLPRVGVTNWYNWMDATKLNNNPFRPLVTILSGTTTLTEYQAWLWFGIALLLLVTGLAIKFVPKHLVIASTASGATSIMLVVMTIFPLWALVWLVFCAIGGWVSERSPSL